MSFESALAGGILELFTRLTEGKKEYLNPHMKSGGGYYTCNMIEDAGEYFKCPESGTFLCSFSGRQQVTKYCTPGCPLDNLGQRQSLEDCER